MTKKNRRLGLGFVAIQEATAPAPAPPRQYIPQTPISDETRRALYREAEEYWAEQADYYGSDGERPSNVISRMQAILGAVDLETAQTALKKAKDCALISLLAAWSNGRIPGPQNPLTVQLRIRKAESLVKMLEGKGLLDQAEKQRARIEELKQTLKSLRQEQQQA